MRIFIAEDDDVSRKALRIMLQKQGYEVLEASDGEKAWRILREQDPPSLLVLDIMMPNMDGLEICRKLRASDTWDQSYIILLTARGGKEDVIEGLDAGANDYITKPYDFEELEARINVGRRMLDMQSSLLNEIAERKQAEEALRENEEKLTQFLYGSPIATFVIDGEHRITHWNKACERLTGFRASDMYGTQNQWEPFYQEETPLIADIVLDNYSSDITNYYPGRLQKSFVKEGAYEVEDFFPYLGENGKWLFCTAAPILDHNGNLIGAMQTIQDTTERKQVERALREREKHLSYITANIPGVVYQFYVTPSGEMGVTYVSQRAKEIFGIAPELDSTFNEFASRIHEEDWDRFMQSIQYVVANKTTWDFEGRFIKDSGETMWFKGVSIPMLEKEHVMFHGILLDITQEKRAQEALRESERKLQTLMSNLPGMAYRCYNSPKRPMEFASQGCTELTGYSVEEMVSREVAEYGEMIHPEDQNQVWKQIQEAIQKGTAFRLQYRIKTRNGLEKWVWEQGQSLGVDSEGVEVLEGFITDITERKTVEDKLRESEETYRAVFENTGAATFIVEADTTISMVNKKFEQISGYSREDIEGRMTWQDFVFQEDLEWMKKYHYKRRENGGEAPNQFEFRFMDRYGYVSYGHVTIGLIPNTGKSVASMVDITERKQMEEERKRLQDQLLQSQKMESVGRLAGGVAHDLNNMLVPILGYTDRLLQAYEEEDDHYKWIEFINYAGQRSRDLVEQLLAFSRKQTLKMEFLDLNQIIQHFQKLLNKTIREYITIQFYLSNDLPPIYADRSQLEQILLNLAVNGQEAMPDGGLLTIETKLADLDDNYVEQYMEIPPGQYVVLAVSDTGVGMDEDIQARIFEPFFSTKGMDEGSGLGLSTVFGIVKQHQGDICFHSEPDRGTRFEIYLPVADSGARENLATVSEETGDYNAYSGYETVLVIEDNDMVREMTVEVLQDQGYNVYYAENGTQCLRFLETYTGSMDLIVTDVIMPDMNGKDLYDRVLEIFPETKVLYMSGYPENVISSHGILEENVAFIQKPFSGRDLNLKVREVLDHG